MQVDAELLVKDLKKSVKRRPSSGVGAGSAVSGSAQQQGILMFQLTHQKLFHISYATATTPLTVSIVMITSDNILGRIRQRSEVLSAAEDTQKWLALQKRLSKGMNAGVPCVCAGTGVQLPWNWKLPQIQNPFAQQALDTASPKTEPTAAIIAPPSLAATPPQPGPLSPAVAGKQVAASRAKLPLEQKIAEQAQWPGWRMGSREEKGGGAAPSDAAPEKPEQRQQGGVPGLRMSQWKNPFEGWGKRVGPAVA